MKWNSQDNLPVEGTYKHREYDKDALRSFVNEQFPCCHCPEIHAALESVDWDLEALLLRKDIDLEFYFYLSLFVWGNCLVDYWIDMENGHIRLVNFEEQKWRGTSSPIHERDFWRRCFYCETEEDIWDLFHDLPFEFENNLKECYYGFSFISDPICVKDPRKVKKMHEYLYGKYKEHGLYLHLGSKLGEIDEDEYMATIVGLAEDHIAVRIVSPLECTASCGFHKDVLGNTKLVVIADNQYFATDYARDMAWRMMYELQSEASFILEDAGKLHDMIVEYQQEKDAPYVVNFYELKQKYFPVVAEIIDFNDDLMCQIELYLKNNHCMDWQSPNCVNICEIVLVFLYLCIQTATLDLGNVGKVALW